MPGFAAPGTLRMALRQFELAYGGVGFGQQRLPRLGQADLTLLTHKQANPKSVFKVLDLSAQGRRCNAQYFGGAGEIAVLCNGQKVAKVAYFHSSISSKVMKSG